MKWIIAGIYEACYGCEERMPGEPLMVMVKLECEDGRILQFEIPDQWLINNNLNEGDEWPEDIETEDEIDIKSQKQSQWMENYLELLEEMKE